MDQGQSEKFVFDLLRMLIAKNASDLFITNGFPPALKVDGKVTPVTNQALTNQQCKEIARSIMNDKQATEFDATKECNFAIGLPNVARFRVNCYIQRGAVGIVFRTIATKIPKFEELGLPDKIGRASCRERV